MSFQEIATRRGSSSSRESRSAPVARGGPPRSVDDPYGSSSGFGAGGPTSMSATRSNGGGYPQQQGFGGATSSAAFSGRGSSSSSSSSAANNGYYRQPDVGALTTQVADWLRQFQANLLLLERLGETLASDPAPSDETLRQIVAQQDVVDELSATLRRALTQDLPQTIEPLPKSQQARPKAALAKLKKDYERVASDVARVVDGIKRSRRSALEAQRNSASQQRRGYNDEAKFDEQRRSGGGSQRPSSSSSRGSQRGEFIPVSGRGAADWQQQQQQQANRTSSKNSGAPRPEDFRAVPSPSSPHRVGRAQFGPSDAPGDLDVVIGDQRVQLHVAMQEEAINDAILREREEEIREINQSVHKVNEIFKDLATLVDKQQSEVDQIGDLVEKSHHHAEKGLDQVQKAAKLQPSCTIS